MATITWDGVKFEANQNGAFCNGVPLSQDNLVARTSGGWLYRTSAGDYPYDSAVVLLSYVNGRFRVATYPTEINPRCCLEVDTDQEQILSQLNQNI